MHDAQFIDTKPSQLKKRVQSYTSKCVTVLVTTCWKALVRIILASPRLPSKFWVSAEAIRWEVIKADIDFYLPGASVEIVEAEQMDRQTLQLSQKVLSAEHPDTLISMGNLALVLSRQGKYVEAEQIPDTLISMDNLASALRRQGRYVEAEQMDQQSQFHTLSRIGGCR